MANKELMITLGLDASSFTQNVKKAKELNKDLDSSFKLLASSSENFEKSLSGLGKKHDYLNKKIKVAEGLSQVYNDRLKESQNELEKAEADMVKYGNQIEKLTRQKKNQIKLYGKDSEAVQATNLALKGAIQLYDKSQKAVGVHNRRIIEAKTGYKDTQTELQKLAREASLTSEKMSYVGADNRLKNMNTSISKLDEDFEKARNSVSNFDNTMDGLSQTQTYNSKKLEISNKLLGEYSNEISNSSKQCEYYERVLLEINKELDVWDELMSSMKGNEPDYQETADHVAKLREEYSHMNKIAEVHQDRLEEMQEGYKKTSLSVSKLTGDLDKTSKKIVSMKEDVTFEPMKDSIQSLTSGTIKKLETQISTLKTEFNEAENSTGGFSKSLSGLNLKKRLLNKTLDKSNILFQEYSKEVKETENTVETLVKKQSDLEGSIKSHIAALKKLDGKEWDIQKKKIDDLKEEYKDVNKELTTHTSKLKESNKGYSQSRKDISELKKELKSTQVQMKQLDKQKIFEGFDRNISKVSGELKLLEAGFKNSTSTIKKFGTHKKDLILKTNHYIEKIKLLEKQHSNLESKLNATQKEYEWLIKTQTSVGKAADDLRAKLINLEKDSPEFNKTLAALSNCEAKYDDLGKSIDKVGKEYVDLKTSVTDTDTEIKVLTQSTKDLGGEFIAGKMESFGNALGEVGEHLESTGNALMGVSIAAATLGTAITVTGVDFSQAMAKVQAVTNSTKEDFLKLEKSALEWGSKTTFSASEAANGLEFLGLAGYTAEQSMKALPEVLKLAQAGSLELGEASDLATDAIASLGSVGDEAVRNLPDLLDKVAMASTKSNTSIRELLGAFIRVGGQFDNMNIPLTESTAILGLLANRGLKAEMAGTSLNSVLINLTKKGGESAKAMKDLGLSAFKANGDIKDIETIVLELGRALNKLDDKGRIQMINMIGGKTQAKAVQKLLQGMVSDTGELTEEYKSLKAEIEKAPKMDSLGEISETMTDTILGDMLILQSTINDVFINTFKEVEPVLRDILKQASGLVRKFGDWFKKLTPETKKFIGQLGVLTVAIAPILTMAGKILILGRTLLLLFAKKTVATTALATATGVSTAATAANTLATATNTATVTTSAAKVGLLKRAMGFLNPAVAGVTLAFGLAIKAVNDYDEKIENKAIPSTDRYISKLNSISVEAGNTATQIRDLVKNHAKFIIDIELGRNVEETTKQMQEVLDSVSKVKRDHAIKDLQEQKRGLEISINLAKGKRKQELEKELVNINKQIELKKKGYEKEVDAHKKKAEKVVKNQAEWNAKEKEQFNLQQIEKINALVESSEKYQEALKVEGAEGKKLIDAAYNEAFGSELMHLAKTETLRREASLKNLNGRISDIQKNKTLSEAEKKNAIQSEKDRYTLSEQNFQLHSQAQINALRNHLGEEFDLFNLETGKMLTAEQQNDALSVEMNRLKNEAILTGNQLYYERIGKDILSFTTNEKALMQDATAKITADFEKRRSSGQMTYDELQNYSYNLQQAIAQEKIKIASENAQIKNSYMSEFRQSGLSLAEFESRYGTLNSAIAGNKTFTVDANGQISKSFTGDYKNAIKKLQELGYGYDATSGKIKDKSGKIIADNVSAKDAVAALGKDGKINLEKLASAFIKSGDDSEVGNEKTKESSKDAKTKVSELKDEITGYNATSIDPKTATINVKVNGAAQAQATLNNIKPQQGNSLLPQMAEVSDNVTEPSVARIKQPEIISRGVLSDKLNISSVQNIIQVELSGIERNLNNLVEAIKNIKNNNRVTLDLRDFKTDGGFYSPSCKAKKTDNNKALIDSLLHQNSILMQILASERDINIDVNVDGKQIAKASAKYIDTEINNITRRKSRLGGAF